MNINTNRFYARNGMHGQDNVGAHDPDPSAHVSVQMTNPALRSQGAWYVLHGAQAAARSSFPDPTARPRTRRQGQGGKPKKLAGDSVTRRLTAEKTLAVMGVVPLEPRPQ